MRKTVVTNWTIVDVDIPAGLRNTCIPAFCCYHMHLWRELDVGPSVSTSLSSYSWGFDILYVIDILLYKQHLQSHKFCLT
jgi:hypothetical protein